MENIIQFEGAAFWVDQNIIYCTIKRGFVFQSFNGKDIETIANIIKRLSNGKFLPMLINLKGLDNLEALKSFNLFSPCSLIGITVLSRSFVVKSFIIKMFLVLSSIVDGNAFWNHIYVRVEEATGFCNEKIKELNMINEI
ncbi:hypothetical protein GGR42_000830 [Saonia flava]|uniref:Uncharacterized protein n=1 Tax=Saonia flava TaxID=523696 RepID=A0A846QQI2_9FLAO|nr:hypothetical protein [Saonia flava]NJB70368.1 hypothetical protein [Saonia flava]